MPSTLRSLVDRATLALASAPNTPHPREAERLVLAATGRTTVDLLARPEGVVPAEAVARLEALLAQRLAGEPVQYILGEWDFHGRTFTCDRRALIPRPETELLIETLAARRPATRSVLDLGTGSGILAVTAALELPSIVRAVAVDFSAGAAALAARNAQQLGAKVDVVVSDWDSALAPDARFEAVLANPPYVDPTEAGLLAPEVRDFEPAEALFSAGNPPAAVRAVLAATGRRLAPGGLALVEIGAGLDPEGTRRCADAEGLLLVEILPDLADIPRALVVERK